MQLFFFIGYQTQVCYRATNILHGSFETESILLITTYAARILHVSIQQQQQVISACSLARPQKVLRSI